MTISANITAASITPSASSWRPEAALTGAGVAAAVASTALPLPTVPGKPVITSAARLYDSEALVQYTRVAFSAPASDGGLPISAYKFFFDNVERTPNTISNGAALFLFVWHTGAAQVLAVNVVGEGPKSDPVTVT